MNRTATLFAIAVGFSTSALPSGGGMSLVHYSCNANEVNARLVDACSKTWPRLTIEASAALNNWRDRYAKLAAKGRERCAKFDIPEVRRTELAAEYQDFLRSIERQAEEESFCVESIKNLGYARNEKFEAQLWQEMTK